MIGDSVIKDSILKAVLDEVELMGAEAFPPAEKSREGEEKIGVLEDEEIKKIFSTATFYMREAQQIQLNMRFTPQDNDQEGRRMRSYERVAALLLSYFWLALESKLDFECSTYLGIRRDWSIVDRRKAPDYISENNPMRGFMQRFIPPEEM